MRVLIIAGLAVAVLVSPPVRAECQFKFQCSRTVEAPKTYPITNNHRQRLGDIYDPGHGRRLQIRNNHRQIIGYIERDGTVTNTHRQKVGTIELGD